MLRARVPTISQSSVCKRTRAVRVVCSAAVRDEGSNRQALSRRDAALALSALAATAVLPVQPVWADEEASTSARPTGGKRVYFEIKEEGPRGKLGRIIVEVFDDGKVGSQRFLDLAEDKQGVGYRLSKIVEVLPEYIRNDGVKSLSYSATAESPIAGGDSVDALEKELAAQTLKHTEAGLVSIVVKDAEERPVKEKLVAMNGKLVTISTTLGEASNGTQFVITRGPAPELDATNLIVGRVISGMDVVETIGALPLSKPRDSWYDGPFFAAGKAMGDKRADVAERGFNRPLKRVIITRSGVDA